MIQMTWHWDMIFIIHVVARQFSKVRDEKSLVVMKFNMKEERTCYKNLGQFIVTGTK